MPQILGQRKISSCSEVSCESDKNAEDAMMIADVLKEIKKVCCFLQTCMFHS